MNCIYSAGVDYPAREKCEHGYFTDENACIRCANDKIAAQSKLLEVAAIQVREAEHIAAEMERQRDAVIAKVLGTKGGRS